MAGEVEFDPDLYRGTGGYYERFRLSYPDAMIADLARRVPGTAGLDGGRGVPYRERP